jgi:hypothetical protein
VKLTGTFRDDVFDTDINVDDVLLFDEHDGRDPKDTLGGAACDVDGGVLVFFPNWTAAKLAASANRTRKAWGV